MRISSVETQELTQNQLDFIRPLFVNAMTVLGFSLDARPTPEQLKKKYRELSLQNHPDKGGDEEKMKEITKAYGLLSGRTSIKLPPPIRHMREWICVQVGGTYDMGTASAGTYYGSW